MKNVNNITIILIGLVLTLLFWNIPPPHERVLNIQNYLITVGGIISALVIAYFSAKIFNIKTERDNRQIQIDKLGERLTAFRQLLFFVMGSRNFWVKYDDIASFKKNYPSLDYEKLMGTGEDPVKDEYESQENKLSRGTIALYTAMEAIYNKKDKHFLPWAYERAPRERYNIDDLAHYYEPCSTISFYLDVRYEKHGKGLFNDKGLDNMYEDRFQEKLSIADERQKGKAFHRLLLASLGNEFYEFVIPKMEELINQNTGIPKGLTKTFYSLLAIMIFGVILPLILQSISLNKFMDTRLTLILVNLTILSLIYFLFELYDLFKEEIETNKKHDD